MENSIPKYQLIYMGELHNIKYAIQENVLTDGGYMSRFIYHTNSLETGLELLAWYGGKNVGQVPSIVLASVGVATKESSNDA